MIMNHIGGHDLQEAEDGAGILRAEVPEQAAIIGTEFQVSFLNQIVEQTWIGFTPISCSSEDDGGDQRTEPPDKFCPHQSILGRETGSH